MYPVKKPVVMKLVPTPDTSNLNEYSDLTVFVIYFRSILNKKGEFLLFLQNVKSKIIIGSETWLSRDILDNKIIPNEFNYTIYRKDHNNGYGGV